MPPLRAEEGRWTEERRRCEKDGKIAREIGRDAISIS